MVEGERKKQRAGRSGEKHKQGAKKRNQQKSNDGAFYSQILPPHTRQKSDCLLLPIGENTLKQK